MIYQGAGMQASSITNPNDPTVNPPPTDTVQCLKWAPVPSMNYLCGAGWDSKATIWEISQTGQNAQKAQTTFTEPVLSVSWKNDITTVFTGSCNNQVGAWNLSSNQVQNIGTHQAPVREVLWCEEINHLISGSWDSTVAFWDTRNPRPTASVNLPGRVLGMSLQYPLLTAIISDKRFAVWNLNRLQQTTQPEISTDNTLKYQIRTIQCFNDAKGFGLGLIEGRVAMKKVTLEPTIRIENEFTFKCHRDSQAHSINSIAFNKLYGTFVTGGSDGSFVFWDKINKSRLKNFTQLGGPVTACDFKVDGSLFAYAIGYDWHKGITGASTPTPTKICYRVCTEEAKPKNWRG